MGSRPIHIGLALAAIALASCTTTLRGRKTLGVPQEPQIREGIPFRMSKPVFVLVGKNLSADKIEYDVAVEYVADPDQYYLVTIDPALFHTNTFGLNFGSSGTLKKVSSTGASQVGPAIAAIGSFAVSALTGVSAIGQISALKDASGVSPLHAFDFAPGEGPSYGLSSAAATEAAARVEILARIRAVGSSPDSGRLDREASEALASRIEAEEKKSTGNRDAGVPKTQAERSVLNVVRAQLEKEIGAAKSEESSNLPPLQLARRLSEAYDVGYDAMRKELIKIFDEFEGHVPEIERARKVGLLYLTLALDQSLLQPRKSPPKPPRAGASLFERVRFSLDRLADIAEQAALGGVSQPTPLYLMEEETLHGLVGTRDKLDQRRALESYLDALTKSLSPTPSPRDGARIIATIQATKAQIDDLNKQMRASITDIVSKGPPGPRRAERNWKLQSVRPACLFWRPDSCAHPRSDAKWVKRSIQDPGSGCQPGPDDFPEFVIVLERGDQR